MYYYEINASDEISDPINTYTNTNTSSSSSCFYLWKGWRDPIAWLILFYTVLGPCTIADICQQKAQASVPAAETNMRISMEPVFTTLLGFLLLGEKP